MALTLSYPNSFASLLYIGVNLIYVDIRKEPEDMLYNLTIFNALSKEDRRRFCEVMEFLNQIDDYLKKNPKGRERITYRCHSICRVVVSYVKGLRVVDGYYLGLKVMMSDKQNKKRTYNIVQCQHSWCLTRSRAIIDPYPVGTLNVNPLIFPNTFSHRPFGRTFYRPDKTVTTIAEKPAFLLETARLMKIAKLALQMKI